MQHDLQRSERERVSQDMMPYTAKLVSAVMQRQNVPKDEFARFVGDIHRAMIDISFESFAIAEDLGLANESAVPAKAEPPRPARGASMGRIVQSLLHPKETLFEPPVPHSVRVPSATTRPPATARLPAEPAVAQPPRPPAAPSPIAPAAPAVAKHPEPAPAPAKVATPPAKAKAPAPVRKKASPDQTDLPFEAAPPASPAPVEAKALSRSAKDRRRYEGPERRSDPLPDKSVDFGPLLPRKLSSIEEALTEDYIVCLEDGKMVKDLEEYLRKKGMTPDQYRAKWKLPPQYPMMAPNTLIKRGAVHEMDPVSGRIFRARV